MQAESNSTGLTGIGPSQVKGKHSCTQFSRYGGIRGISREPPYPWVMRQANASATNSPALVPA